MPSSARPDRVRWLDPALLLATCGWVGRIPVAPGTFGSLVGLPLSLAAGAVAAWLTGTAVGTGAIACEAMLIAAAFLAGVFVCGRAARLLGSEDPGPVVLDEAVAVPLVLLAVPLAERGVAVLAAAFVLFRFFDIVKPPPVGLFERLPGGLGIMADDVVAAVMAAACLAVARWQGWP